MLFLQAGDVLRSMLDAHQGRGSVDPAAVEVICQRLRELSSGRAAVVATPAKSSQPEPVKVITAGQDEEAVRIPPDRGYHCYNIQFVPTQIATQGVGVENLLEELRGLGELHVLNQPVDQGGEPGYWDLRLISSQDRKSVV